MKALKHLNKYFYKYRYRLIIGIFITIIANVFKLFTPRFVGDTITVISNKLDGEISYEVFKTELITNIIYIVGAAVIAGLLTFLMRQTIINVSRYIEYDLKNEIYKHYQVLSLNFYKSNRTGDLMNRISEDVGKVRMYAGPALMYGINMITLFTVAIIYMVKTAPILTLYTLLPLPILSFAIYQLSRLINKRSTVVQESLSTLSTYSQETFSGISVIKSYGIETKTNSEFEDLSVENRQKQINLTKVQALFFPLMILLIGISNLLVIYIGGKQYINGEIENIGTIAEFIIYVNMLTWPVAVVGWVTSIIQQAEVSQKRINEFLKQKPSIKNLVEEPSVIKGNIEFKNVSFEYEDTNITALKNISFKVDQGKTIAIMGRTGSGKSTIAALVARLYDSSSGEILVDGTPIRDLNLESLRGSIGFVPQDFRTATSSLATTIQQGQTQGLFARKRNQ